MRADDDCMDFKVLNLHLPSQHESYSMQSSWIERKEERDKSAVAQEEQSSTYQKVGSASSSSMATGLVSFQS